MNDKQDANPILKALLVLILIFVFFFTYFLMFGRHSYRHEDKPFEGFTYTKTSEKDGKIEQAVFTTDSKTPLEETHQNIQVPKNGYLFNNFETLSVVLPKNKFSHIAAVRDAHFTWDDTPYYKAHTAKLSPMAHSNFDSFVEEKLMTKLDNIDLNQEMIPLMRQAQKNTSIKDAAAMIENGKYDEALKSLRATAQTTDNICVKSAALSHIVNIYRLTGDSVQEHRAWGALAVVNTQFYLKTFPDKANALKSVSAVAQGAIKRFETDKPNLNFKLPNKDF